MYTLHLGLLVGSENAQPMISVGDLGLSISTSTKRKRTDSAVFYIETEAEMGYHVVVDPDSFELWGEQSAFPSLHLTIKLTHEPSGREVEFIRAAIAQHMVSGRFCDWAVLTNEENWSQVVAYYLWHANDSRYPAVVPVDPRKE